MAIATQPVANGADFAGATGALGGRSLLARAPLVAILGWAVLITLLQVLVACVLAGGHSPREAYGRLVRWDGGWYAAIVESGYFAPKEITPKLHGNVAFFPGYPFLAWSLTKIFGLSTSIALLLVAQAACWAFWTYLLLFFERWQVAARLRVLGVLLVSSHPGAFYLVASYSESLFLASVLGFLYWTGSARRGAGLVAAAHGLVMTATRLVGLPLVVYPLCQAVLGLDGKGGTASGTWTRRYGRALLLGATASLGTLFFFGYCQVRFGAWDTYMKTGQAGWGIRPDYLGMFSYRIFKVHYPAPHEKWVDPEFFSRLAVPVAVLFFLVLAIVEGCLARSRANGGWRVRCGLYVCALLMLYVPVSAQCTRGMTSMVRYALCVQVMLAIAIVHLLGRLWPLDRRTDDRLVWLFTAWCEICFILQILFMHRYVHGKWVA